MMLAVSNAAITAPTTIIVTTPPIAILANDCPTNFSTNDFSLKSIILSIAYVVFKLFVFFAVVMGELWLFVKGFTNIYTTLYYSE
jgi:hypothetical protein